MLIRVGDGDYLGGETFFKHGRAMLSLVKGEAAVWPSYNRGGRLLEDAIHAAGRVFDGEKVIVAALWTLDGFKRAPIEEMDKQARLIAQGKATHRSVRGTPLRYN